MDDLKAAIAVFNPPILTAWAHLMTMRMLIVRQVRVGHNIIHPEENLTMQIIPEAMTQVTIQRVASYGNNQYGVLVTMPNVSIPNLLDTDIPPTSDPAEALGAALLAYPNAVFTLIE